MEYSTRRNCRAPGMTAPRRSTAALHPAVIESGASTERRLGQPFPSGHRGRIGSPEPNRDVALVVEARARLDSFGFSPRLDGGEEFYGVRFRADFYVAEAIDEPLDEAPLPDRTLRHAGEAG